MSVDLTDIKNWPDGAEACIDGMFTKWINDEEYELYNKEWIKDRDSWDLASYEAGGWKVIMRPQEPDAWKEGEKRMNNIAQNGNDGHYEESGTVDTTLEERGNRYGEFSDVAATTQNIKSVMHNGVSCEALTPVQWEALSMIASKIARIVNGDPDYADNWHDIAGYARLVEKELEK